MKYSLVHSRSVVFGAGKISRREREKEDAKKIASETLDALSRGGGGAERPLRSVWACCFALAFRRATSAGGKRREVRTYV